MIRRPLVLLDHQAGDAASAQIAGEREPDRAAADDQDGGFDGVEIVRQCGMSSGR